MVNRLLHIVRKLWSQTRWLLRSSTLRLSLLLSLVFAIGFAVAIFVALTLGQSALERRVDTTLQALASAAELDGDRSDSPSLILRPLSDLAGLPQPFRRAVTRGRDTVFLQDDYMRSEIWRVLVTRDAEGAPVLAAVPLDDAENAQDLLAGILWTTAALVVVLTMVIGLAAGLLAQRRLGRINKALGRLAAGDLTARTGNTRARDDLDDIARHLDHAAAALERLVAQTRHLSASIAHDLRTPLARLRAQLEMLPDGEERALALEEASNLTAIFDTIMRVARIEAGQGTDGFETIDLSELAQDLFETFEAVVEDDGKKLHLSVDRTGTITADRGMLVQALANLIQNGLVHGGLNLTLSATGQSIGVSDDGAGVDPARFEEILRPMVRLDAARSTPGSGLGLALVKAVADRHGAKLQLEAGKPRGLRVMLNFAKM